MTKLGCARRVMGWLTVAVAAIDAVVWVLVSIIGGSLDAPWFLWELALGGAVIGGLWVVEWAQRRWPLRASQTRPVGGQSCEARAMKTSIRS